MERRNLAAVKGLWLVARGIGLFALVEIAAVSLNFSGSLYSEQILLRATFVLVLSIAFLPHGDLAKKPSIALLLSWCFICGATLLAGLLRITERAEQLEGVFLLSGGLALLVSVFSGATLAMAYRLGDRRLSSRIVLAVLLLLLSSPLWLSPLAAVNGACKSCIDVIVAICPISYMATLVEVDYLRGIWMYQHTVYGGLRFDYPNLVLSTACIVLLTMAFTILGKFQWPWRKPRSAMAGTSEGKLEINS